MIRRILVCIVATTAWLANPMLGCTIDDSEGSSDFAFGEPEMRTAVKGTYTGTLTTTGETVTIELDEATASGSNQKSTQSYRKVNCLDRSFVRSAGACISATRMSISGRIDSTGTGIASGEISGEFSTYGRLLGGANLRLSLPDGTSINAVYSESVGMNQWELTKPDGARSNLELARAQ